MLDMNEDSVLSSQDFLDFFRLLYLPPADSSRKLYCLFEEKSEVGEELIKEFVGAIMRRIGGGSSDGISFEQFKKVMSHICK